jgi:hypothetical protein
MSEMDEKIQTEATKAEVEDHHDPAVEHTEDTAFGPAPTDEDWKALREVADTIPKSAFLVILIEFCERFTYYGLSGPFQNYIQNPAPDSCKYNLIISQQLSSLSYSYSLLFPYQIPLLNLVLLAEVSKLPLLSPLSFNSGVMSLPFSELSLQISILESTEPFSCSEPFTLLV